MSPRWPPVLATDSEGAPSTYVFNRAQRVILLLTAVAFAVVPFLTPRVRIAEGGRVYVALPGPGILAEVPDMRTASLCFFTIVLVSATLLLLLARRERGNDANRSDRS